MSESGEFSIMKEQMFITVLETIGIIAFSISGALMGVKKRHDVFGVIFMGIVTALGGGVLRDLLIGNTPPVMFQNYRYVVIAAAVSLVTFAIAYCIRDDISRYAKVFNGMLNYMDALGLGVFTLSGMNMAIEKGYQSNALLVVFVGVLTGIGGGMLRDVLAREVPFVLYKRIYAVACICGGILYYFLLHIGVPQTLAMIDGMFCIFLIRLIAAWLKLDLPKIS